MSHGDRCGKENRKQERKDDWRWKWFWGKNIPHFASLPPNNRKVLWFDIFFGNGFSDIYRYSSVSFLFSSSRTDEMIVRWRRRRRRDVFSFICQSVSNNWGEAFFSSISSWGNQVRADRKRRESFRFWFWFWFEKRRKSPVKLKLLLSEDEEREARLYQPCRVGLVPSIQRCELSQWPLAKISPCY